MVYSLAAQDLQKQSMTIAQNHNKNALNKSVQTLQSQTENTTKSKINVSAEVLVIYVEHSENRRNKFIHILPQNKELFTFKIFTFYLRSHITRKECMNSENSIV